MLKSLRGQQTTVSYNNDHIVVRNSAGDQLIFFLNGADKVVSATLNGAAVVIYTYDKGRLVALIYSDNSQRKYHYENSSYPNHLTGITDERGVRIATWEYDEQGRGVVSEHAGQERVQLSYPDAGSTLVTNSLGKQTTYYFSEIEGMRRVIRVEGHASENCLAAHQAYTYYPNGQLKTQTDWEGNVTYFEYNTRGLMTRLIEAKGTPEERITRWTWDPVRPLKTSRTRAGRITRYHYDSAGYLIKQQDSAAP